MLVDGAPARKKHVLRAGEEVVWQAPPPPDGHPGGGARALTPSSTRTTGCSWSTSRRAWWCTRRPDTSTGRSRRDSWRRARAAATSSRPGIVHRLDKDTSGLLIVARRDEAYRRLVAAMERRDIHRTYLALLSGDLPQDKGTIDAPIGRHLRDRKRMSLHTAAGTPRR